MPFDIGVDDYSVKKITIRFPEIDHSYHRYFGVEVELRVRRGSTSVSAQALFRRIRDGKVRVNSITERDVWTGQLVSVAALRVAGMEEEAGLVHAGLTFRASPNIDAIISQFEEQMRERYHE